jgi:2-polyprenyl-3-methyl-5-hydroxy-6-metoxy-1,4-benzoquinol methylase
MKTKLKFTKQKCNSFRLNNSNQSIKERWSLVIIKVLVEYFLRFLMSSKTCECETNGLWIRCNYELGNTAIRARRLGAKVTGIDIIPQLLAQTKEESIAKVRGIDWREGNAQNLLYLRRII